MKITIESESVKHSIEVEEGEVVNVYKAFNMFYSVLLSFGYLEKSIESIVTRDQLDDLEENQKSPSCATS